MVKALEYRIGDEDYKRFAIQLIKRYPPCGGLTMKENLDIAIEELKIITDLIDNTWFGPNSSIEGRLCDDMQWPFNLDNLDALNEDLEKFYNDWGVTFKFYPEKECTKIIFYTYGKNDYRMKITTDLMRCPATQC